MGFRNVVSDGSANPPRLRIQQSLRGLTGLPRDGMQWSIADRLDKISVAGFTGLEISCHTEQEADEISGLALGRGLSLGYTAEGEHADDLLPSIELAHRMRADYLSVRVRGSLKSSPQIADILNDMFDLVNDASLPLFIETQRGTITQDLRRTVKVINRFKKVRFTGDFSNYVLAAAMDGAWNDDVWEHFRPIARRCGSWHGRISFGHQIQNDIADGAGEVPAQFKKLWTMAMVAWLKKSDPGDVLPFTCELPASPEADVDLAGREISDRWEQSLVIKRLAEEAWKDAESVPELAAEPDPASTEPAVAPEVPG